MIGLPRFGCWAQGVYGLSCFATWLLRSEWCVFATWLLRSEWYAVVSFGDGFLGPGLYCAQVLLSVVGLWTFIGLDRKDLVSVNGGNSCGFCFWASVEELRVGLFPFRHGLV